MIPFEEIQKNQDRSWSLKLVQLIADGQLAEIDEITETLSELDDYRALAALTRLLEDVQQVESIRSAASRVLAQCCSADTESDRRRWWNSSDPVLMRHAVRVAERTESDLIERLAQDPAHEFYCESIDCMEFNWEQKKYQQMKIAALQHARESVRACAANVLLWDEPVAAIEPLLVMARTDTDEVAENALNTLQWYSSKRVLLELHELRHQGRSSLRESCEEAYAEVLSSFSDLSDYLQRDDAAAKHIQRWLGEAAKLLKSEPEGESLESKAVRDGSGSTGAVPSTEAPSVEEIMDDLNDADGLWQSKHDRYMRLRTWGTYDDESWRRLSQFLVDHPDPVVREIGCAAAGGRSDSPMLLVCLADSNLSIRKAAAYNLRNAPPSDQIAKRLWENLSRVTTNSTHAYETLESWVHHAREDAVVDSLLELAINDERESVVGHAIYQLGKRASRQRFQELLPLLSREPMVTWSVHSAIIHGCATLGIKVPCLSEFSDADDLFLQSYVAAALLVE